VLPISYFLEKPFQNWTRQTAEILGTVFLYVDYDAPAIVGRSIREDTASSAARYTMTERNGSQRVFDDQGRMMAIICHNTDLGDGWEREGENVEYFRQFSEKWSYPLGINIVVYALTH